LERKKYLLSDLPVVGASLGGLAVAAARALVLAHVVRVLGAASARDVRGLAALLAHARSAFHALPLLWADHGDRVAAQEDHAELSLERTIDVLLGVLKDGVDVDVKSAQDADVGPAILELDDNAFSACHIQCV